jgi:hypothetical protein
MAEPQSKDPERGEPFITRHSLLWFSGVATAAFVAYSELYDASSKGAGRLGLAAAGAFGVAAVLGLIAWLGGIRMAGRSGSLLWLVVVAMTPVVGSLCYALWGPTTAVPPPNTPGGRR